MDKKLILLSEETSRGDLRSPTTMLAEALDDHVSGDMADNTKAMVLSLYNKDGEYNVSWYQAGMKCSEMLALLEVAKVKILQDMGY